ncbi:MAG: copper homeostasis protein CutC [Saprospiraceae bacterium]|nr:copper homeostasis protein CutC [Saprospiraceae bacterium]
MFTLEITAHSLQSCLAAQEGGADRIELCAALQSGGLTPSLGLLRAARQSVELPIHVLIRPRIGGFVYSEHELEEMKTSIEICREEGVDGIVTGCLQANGAIDLPQLAYLFAAAEGLEKTFHRAFDLIPDPLQGLQQLKQLACDRILTSGQKPTALEGSGLIKRLIYAAHGTPTILAGAGINSENILDVAHQTGASEFHASAKIAHASKGIVDHVGVTKLGDQTVKEQWQSDREEIERMVRILKNLDQGLGDR